MPGNVVKMPEFLGEIGFPPGTDLEIVSCLEGVRLINEEPVPDVRAFGTCIVRRLFGFALPLCPMCARLSAGTERLRRRGSN